MPQESKGLITGGIQALLVALITSFLLTLSSGYSKVQANTKDIEELKDAIKLIAMMSEKFSELNSNVSVIKNDLEWVRKGNELNNEMINDMIHNVIVKSELD